MYYVIEVATAGLCLKSKRRAHVVGVHSSRTTADCVARYRNSKRHSLTSVVYKVVTGTEAKRYNLSM